MSKSFATGVGALVALPLLLGAANLSQAQCGYSVVGAINSKYQSLGGVGGLLGWPTTNELPGPDGAGRFNHFVGGSIYWTPATGAWSCGGQFASLGTWNFAAGSSRRVRLSCWTTTGYYVIADAVQFVKQ